MSDLIERLQIYAVAQRRRRLPDNAALADEAASELATLQSQLAARDQELAEIREILFGCLDRDRDNITTRNLAAVASNALHHSRAELAEARKDAARLDWLPGGIDRIVYQCLNGEWCAQDDVIGAWYGATPREAIDAAIDAAAGEDA